MVEFIEAARLLVAREVTTRFVVAGEPDPGNPSSVSEEEVGRWWVEGLAEFPGYCADVAGLFRDCHVVVLPSYREGLPKVLIEAAACGRALAQWEFAIDLRRAMSPTIAVTICFDLV